jgi:hypothetical protein
MKMEYISTDRGIILLKYKDIKENKNILPVLCNEKEIDDNTTIVFEKYNNNESTIEKNPSGNFERVTLWLCDGFAFCNCGQIHYVKSSVPQEKQLDEIIKLGNFHNGPFDNEKEDTTEGLYIYGFVHLEDLDNNKEWRLLSKTSKKNNHFL